MSKFDFVHSSDLHFGKGRNISGYLERQCQAMDFVYDTARENNVGTVLIVGDIYERETLRDSEREAFTERLLQRDTEGFTTLIINGNHDWCTETQYNIWDILMLQDKGKFKNTFIITGDPRNITLNGIDFTCIPNRGVRKGYSTEELCPIMNDLCTDKSVVLLHELLLGSSVDTGRTFNDHGCEIKCNVIPKYVALGDVHKHQRLGYAQYYSGSVIQLDFGDKMPKGCLLVDLENPDKPEMKEASHIKKFVITDKVEEIYQDAYVAYIGSRSDLPLNKPESLVQIRDISDKKNITDYTKLKQNDITDGLQKFLADQGLNDEEQMIGVKEIEEIIKIGDINIVY
jgi:DNA repair exonuclease SbcCD nuclease subunit